MKYSLVVMMMVVVLAAITGPATMAVFLTAVFNMKPVAEAPAEPALPDNWSHRSKRHLILPVKLP